VEFYVIGDEELVIGFRFVGVPGQAVASRAEAEQVFTRATTPGFPAMVLILTEQVSAMIGEQVMQWQLAGSYPLVVEIPGIEGHLENRRSLVDSIREAVGVHV
jgi:V/A-type H+-transporting ATPase subunit F